jgi:hypothetical protein
MTPLFSIVESIDGGVRGRMENIYGFSMAVERKSFPIEWVICVLP